MYKINEVTNLPFIAPNPRDYIIIDKELIKGLSEKEVELEHLKTVIVGLNEKLKVKEDIEEDLANSRILLNDAERKQLVGYLKNLPFDMTGYRGWNEAIVTAGGVSLNEVDDSTMASKLVHGLFFAGEVFDLTGNTGGYNLQIAFSTGWLAGQSAAAFVQKIPDEG